MYDGSCWFLLRFFNYPILVVVFKKNCMVVVHFFSQDFRNGTNSFGSVNYGMDDYFTGWNWVVRVQI